jgi:hypothetical protein
MAARAVDDLVAQQVLRALEPAAVELSMRAQSDIEQERKRLEKHWQQRHQRARYDTELAERRYQAVDPENRLVAGTLEKRWEELLVQEKQLQEEYDRFRSQTPVGLSPEERTRIAALTSDIPALWNGPGTTNVDRKQIVRCLVERVTVHLHPESEFAGVTIQWAGGFESQHEIIRPVRRYEQLRDLEPLLDRAQELRASGQTVAQIAEQLNTEGFHTPTGRGRIKGPMVNQLLQRRGVITEERANDGLLGKHEWWLTDLADELQTTRSKLQEWALRALRRASARTAPARYSPPAPSSSPPPHLVIRAQESTDPSHATTRHKMQFVERSPNSRARHCPGWETSARTLLRAESVPARVAVPQRERAPETALAASR